MFAGATGDGLLPGLVSGCGVLALSWPLRRSVTAVARASVSCSSSGEHSFLGGGLPAPWVVV